MGAVVLETRDQVEKVVRSVEACEFPLPDWHHSVHLAVSTWYLEHLPFEEAVDTMRATIQRFNAHNKIPVTGETGYHETLTLAWLRKIRIERDAAGPDATFEDRLARVLEACGDKFLLRRHYTRDTMMSWEARRSWVEPDIRPFDPGPH